MDNTIKILNGQNGDLLGSLEGFQRGIFSVSVSPDGKYVAGSGGEEGIVDSYEIHVFELATGKLISRLLGHTHIVNGVAFSADGRMLASAAADKFVKVWNPLTGEELRTLSGHQNGVYNVAFSHVGRRLVSAGFDGVALVWDIDSINPVATLKGHDGEVTSAVFSPDDRQIATGGRDGTLKFWDTMGRLQFTHAGHGSDVRSLSYSPDGRQIVSASFDGTARIWNTESDQQFIELGHQRLPILGAALDQSGNRFVTFGPQTGVFQNEYALWDIPSKRMLRSEQLVSDFSPFRTIDISRDGNLVLACGGNFVHLSQIHLWEADNGRTRWKITDLKSQPICCAIDPAGGQVAVGCRDGRLEFRDISDGRLLSERLDQNQPLAHVRYSSAGEWLATVGSDQTRIWDRSGSIKLTIASTGNEYRSGGPPIVFRPDNKAVALTGDTTKGWPARNVIRVIEIESGRVISTMRGHVRDIASLDFSPGGKRIASGSDDNRIKIWDAATGDELLTLSGHSAPVSSVHFGPDGHSLVSTGEDGAVLFWDASAPEQLAWLPANHWPSELTPLIEDLQKANPAWPGIVRSARQIHKPEGNRFHLDLSGHIALTNIGPLSQLASLQSRGLTLSLDLSGTRVSDLSPLATTPLRELRLRGTPIRNLNLLRDLPLELLDVRQTSIEDLGLVLQGSAAKTLKNLWCDPRSLPDHDLLAKLPNLNQINETPLSEFLATSMQEIVLAGHTGEVRSVDLHPSGKLVASAATDGTVRLWSIASRSHDLLLEASNHKVGPVMWSIDGRSLVWCVHPADGRVGSEIVIWDAEEQQIVSRRTLTDVATCLAPHPIDRRFVCGSSTGALRLLSYDNSDEVEVITPTTEGMEALSVAVSSDGQRLAAGFGRSNNWASPGELQIWNLTDGKLQSNLRYPSAFRSVTFAPGLHYVAYTDGSRIVRLADCAAPAVTLATCVPHDGRSRVLRFIAPDLLVSAGEEDSLVLAPLAPKPREEAEKVLLPKDMIHFNGHKGTLWSVSSTPDGTTLATGGSDGTVRIWNRH